MNGFDKKNSKTLKMINSTEERSIAEWKALYPDVCLFLAVTAGGLDVPAGNAGWRVQKARLIATAEDEAEFLDLARSCPQSEAVYTIRKGGSEPEGGPVLAPRPGPPPPED